MERRWVGLDGYEVVGAVRAGRQVLRVRRHGRVVADCSSVAEVARHVDLADLCEVVELPVRAPAAEIVAEAGTSSHHR
ncbi:transposase [Actinomadura sp. ATCC 31491]|uniref:Transposase n=1 Tax=Actinomadura luzonensis TaxID=2805427 RepID=A0ABT0FR78_9ACTN|nr:transposase [Actinomadura luzonensis]MCK2214825.1 transposase [Actinomadura luzonensis]